MTEGATLHKFAENLEKLLLGEVEPKHVREAYWNISDAEIELLMGNVEHFMADEDIRQKDVTYCEMQELEMKKLIVALRNGDIAVAKRITFLSCSK